MKFSLISFLFTPYALKLGMLREPPYFSITYHKAA